MIKPEDAFEYGLCNQVPVQASVLDGFGEVGGTNLHFFLDKKRSWIYSWRPKV